MKPIFKASDDSEHPSKAAAQRRERIIKAGKDFESARDAYEAAIGESCLTADGEPFDMGNFRDYWRVQQRYMELPYVAEISVYPHGLSIDQHNRKMVVRWYEHREGRDSSYTTLPIGDLYADKENAERARLALMESDLAEFTESVEKVRAALAAAS